MEDIAATVPAAHIILTDQDKQTNKQTIIYDIINDVFIRFQNKTHGWCERDSPGLRSEAVPGELEQLEA